MTECPCVRVCRRLVVSALTAFCLWRSFDTASAYFEADGVYACSDGWRTAARCAPEGGVALLCNDADVIAPLDRSRLIAIAWERAPDPISQVDAKSGFESAGCVLSSSWHSRSVGKRLEECGFSVVATNEYVKTWGRAEAVRAAGSSSVGRVSPARESVALTLWFLLAVGWIRLAAGPRGIGLLPAAVALGVVAALGCVALSHPLLEPNGLGVYGGKAKLWYLCGGMPSAFLESIGGAVLQPSYPPGLALLAYFHFVLSGGCGDRLVQLLPVLAAGLLCFALTRDGRNRLTALPAALFCLSPVAIRLTSGFYAEPFVALLLVTGWGMMREGRLRAGACILGLAGLFRPEAGVVAVVFAFFGGWFRGGRFPALFAAAFASVPALAWLVACAAFGFGTVQDWNFLVSPKAGQSVVAAGELLKSLSELAVPTFAIACLARGRSASFASDVADGPWRIGRDLLRASVPAALLLLAIPLACGFYAAPQARWMIGNTVPRLAWYLLAVPLSELLRRPVKSTCYPKNGYAKTSLAELVS